MSGQGSGRIIGGIIGAAAAYFTGGISLAGGFAIGSIIGGALDKGPSTEGPRLDDVKVQYSSFGVGIPRIYYNARLSGNVIWSTDKLEIANTTGGGKGGGPENTSYRYYVWMSLLLCETPRDGSIVSIVKMFKDGDPIWDASSGIPIESALASAENLYAGFELFQGHADQLPDPIEEGFSGGPGSCSAYRGVVRIRMNAIECPEGRVPQFSFVLSTAPAVVDKSLYATVPGSSGFATREAIWGFNYNAATHVSTITRASPGQSPVEIHRLDLGVPYTFVNRPTAVVGATKPTAIFTQGLAGTPAQDVVSVIDLESGAVTEIHRADFGGPAIGYGTLVHAAYDATSQQYAVTSGFSQPAARLTILPSGLDVDVTGVSYLSPIAFDAGIVYALNRVLGNLTISVIKASDGTNINTLTGPAFPLMDLAYSSIQVNGATAFVRAVGDSPSDSRNFRLELGVFSATWIQFPGNSDFFTPDDPAAEQASAAFFSATDSIYGPGGNGEWTYLQYTVYDPQPGPVSLIIAEQCELADETRYDVSEIPDTDEVIGYLTRNPASARANIQPFLDAFGIFIVDEDGLIKFKKQQNVVSVGTISYDELGVVEVGGEPGDPMPLIRKQEVDFPKRLTVNYINKDSDFQTASQPVGRALTDAIEDRTIDLTMVITSDQAATAGTRMLFAAWSGQNARTCKVSQKYAFVSPGDGVTIEYPRGTQGMYRVTSVAYDGLTCEWSLEPGDAELFTQTAVGATGYAGQQVAPLVQPLRAVILDIPILRDEDNNAGPYVALDSFGSVPANGELFVGVVSDANPPSRGTVSASAPIGFAETVLGAFVLNMVDECNLLTVNIGDDEFNSVTRDVLLANGGEFWALGAPGRYEIGCSAKGASLGGGRYILSEHLRGLFGTEQYVGTHQVGDTFVLLRSVGILRPDSGVGAIGQDLAYRAVARGRSFDSASSQVYANTGEGLMPLSPVDIRRTDTNDFTIDRRSRLAMNNVTGALPLGETSERYSWEFYTSSAFTNLIGTVVTSVEIVTAAQQTAIGRTPSTTAYIRVGQVSDSIGVGHHLQATI